MIQIIPFNTGNITSGPRWTNFSSGSNSATSEAVVSVPWNVNGTFKNLRLKLLTPITGADTTTATLYVNGVASALTVTLNLANGSDASDIANDVAVVAGDTVSIQYDFTGSATGGGGHACIEFEPTTTGERGYLAGGGQAVSDIAAGYMAVFQNDGGGWGTTATMTGSLVGAAGTMNGYRARLSAAPGAAKTYTFVLVKNGTVQDGAGGTVNTTVAITGAATTTGSASFSLILAEGDDIYIRCTPSGTPNFARAVAGFSYTPDNPEEIPYSAKGTTALVTLGTPYFGSMVEGNTFNAVLTEPTNQIIVSVTPFKVARLRVEASAAVTATISLRRNGTDPATAPTIVLSAATTGSDLTRTLNFHGACERLSTKYLQDAGSIPASVRFGWVMIPGTIVTGACPPSDDDYESGVSRFRNGVSTNVTGSIGVTWIEFTSRSGDLYVWSDKPLPDPESYYHGWKEPRVKKFGRIRRAISLRGDGPETSDFTWLLDDSDGLLTQLDADKELVNGTFVSRSITDEGRRLEATPRTIYRGVVRDAKPVGTLLYEMRGQDVFAAVFSGTTDQQLVPSRTVQIEDFANCAIDLVSSSAEGYQANGAASAGASTVNVNGGIGELAPGDKIQFSGHSTVYSVTGSSQTDPEASVSFSPDLTSGVADNEAITQTPSHHVEPAAGKRVPFGYGHPSDMKLSGGVDLGDGQGPSLYVGDKVLADGNTWGEFIWQGHACYVVGGCPFDMFYFWNESVDYLSGTLAGINDFTTEAGSGGRIAVPGFDNWTDLGFTTPYVDYGGSPGRRYTVFYLRGIFRDWALGIRPAPPNLGGEPFAVNGYGAETVGDSSGLLMVRSFEIYLHICLNWIPPVGESYQSGLWATESPTFPDDPDLPVIDENSFFLADDQSEVYVAESPGGFRWDFIVGANNEAITRRELIARLNNSSGSDCFSNHRCQFAVTLFNTDLASTTLQPGLTWVRDIFSGTWQVEPLTRELHPAVAFRHTQDYFGRATGGWRSVLTGTTELSSQASIDAYGPGPASAPILMHMVRGKNRASDPDEHQQGTDTATVVLAIALARISSIQHLPKFQTGPAGFNYELADVVPVTAYQAAYEDRPLRAERLEIDPSEFTTNVEWYDIDPVLGAIDTGSP